MKPRLLLTLLVLPSALFARGNPESSQKPPPPPSKELVKAEEEQDEAFQGPFLTGPLLTASANTIPKGHFNIELYINLDNNIAYYTNHWHVQKFSDPPRNVNFVLSNQIGLTKRMDFTITPQFFFNYNNDTDSWQFGDLAAALGFQLLFEDNKNYIPSLKLSIGQVFPTGSFQHLDPANESTDAAGGGSFNTQFYLTASYLWHLKGPHYLAIRWQNGYIFFTQVRVNGLNSYGGDASTVGWVLPGGNFRSFLGLECTLSVHWAIALDIAVQYTNPTIFKGQTFLPVGNDSWSYQLSLAPAIEYNVDSHLGFITGVWFTVDGRNTFDFINVMIAFNWYI